MFLISIFFSMWLSWQASIAPGVRLRREEGGAALSGAFYVNLDENSESNRAARIKLSTSRLIRESPGGIRRMQGVYGNRIDLHQYSINGSMTKDTYSKVIVRDRIVGGGHLTEGAIGCAESHIAVWREAAKAQNWTLVFEDDIALRPNFDTVLSQLLQRLPPDAGMLYFGNMIGAPIARSLHDFDDMLWRMDGNHWGTYAYMISPSAAQTLLDNVYPLSEQIDSMIINIAAAHNISVFMSKLRLVQIDNTPNRKSNVQRYSVAPIHIPKHFHFLWLGDAPLPLQYQENIRAWQEMYPSWQVQVWREDSLPRMVNRRLFNHATSLQQKSDIARYEIILQYGGIFLDVHFVPLKVLTPVLHGIKGFVAWETETAISNGVFGAVPGHPLIRALVENLEENWQQFEHGSISEQTGQAYFTTSVRESGLTLADEFRAFSTQVFFPFQRDHPDPGPPYGDLSYAVHRSSLSAVARTDV